MLPMEGFLDYKWLFMDMLSRALSPFRLSCVLLADLVDFEVEFLQIPSFALLT